MSKTINCIVTKGYGLRAAGKQYAGGDKVALSEKDAKRLADQGIVSIVKAEPKPEASKPAAAPKADKA